MRDGKRWAWALGITLVLSVLWMIAGGALVYNYFPPEPEEKVIVWDTQTGNLIWHESGVRYRIDFGDGIMYGPDGSYPLSRYDYYMTYRGLAWLAQYCAESTHWYRNGGQYQNEQKEKDAEQESYELQQLSEENDPALRFADSYNVWIRYWDQQASPWIVDYQEIQLWARTKTTWRTLQKFVDRFYGI